MAGMRKEDKWKGKQAPKKPIVQYANTVQIFKYRGHQSKPTTGHEVSSQ